MAKKKKLKGAEAYGFKVIIDPSLNQHAYTEFFVEELARVNEMLSKVKNWPPELLKK